MVLRMPEVGHEAVSSCLEGCIGYTSRFIFSLKIYIFNLKIYIFNLKIYIFSLKIYIFSMKINLEIGIKHLLKHTEVALSVA